MSTRKIRVIKFSADWCQTCRLLEPSFKQLEAEYKQDNKPIVFDTMDADNDDARDVFNEYEISTMPTIVLLLEEIDDNNKIVSSREITRINGLKPKQVIKTLLDTQLDYLEKQDPYKA